jgi:hypothetical protein
LCTASLRAAGKSTTDEYAAWFTALTREDPGSVTLLAQAVAALREDGPSLGRPLVDRLKGSWIHHLKELIRPGSRGRSGLRIIFAFDPTRSALLLDDLAAALG